MRMCAAYLIAKERNVHKLNCLNKHSVIGYLSEEHKGTLKKELENEQIIPDKTLKDKKTKKKQL